MVSVMLFDRRTLDLPSKSRLCDQEFTISKERGKHLLNPDNRKILELCTQLRKQSNGQTLASIKAAGLRYTDEGDTARCEDCRWEYSGWTPQMEPFKMHAENSPRCPYILKMKSGDVQNSDISTTAMSIHDSSSRKSCEKTTIDTREHDNNGRKRQKLETPTNALISDNWKETKLLEQVRRRTFTHWPHRHSPTSAQMVEAGFFSCNVGDRVICIYCNLICQQWTPHGDDPCEVHKTISPHCIFVVSKVLRREQGSILIVNETATTNSSANDAASSDRNQSFRGQTLVHTVACHPMYAELPKRHASFGSWQSENLPSVDDLVRAGFFYSGTKNIVTCFYCNGSLQNWGAKDNPMIEHARWFPHCAYAKQLCGEDLYRKIQESKRAQQERLRAEDMGKSRAATATTSTSPQDLKLHIPDESTLSRLVAARLDLPISQRLLSAGFKLSIIKRCWEDQLRLKHDDFTSDCDLHMACTILQKQIECIDGKKENITIPSSKMKQIRETIERQRLEAIAREQTASNTDNNRVGETATTSQNNLVKNDTRTSTAVQGGTDETSSPMETMSTTNATPIDDKPKSMPGTNANSAQNKSMTENNLNNPCVICMQEEKGLACIPCGHLATCVPCGHSLRSCPLCRREIEAFVRVYV